MGSLGLSVALVLAGIGAWPDLAMHRAPFAYKIASMLALGLAGPALASVLTILGASLPPLIILLGVMRMGAVTRPAVAGAMVGALSGSSGAIAYALACRNDAGSFVAIGYPLAIVVMAAVGAMIGRRALI